MNFQDISKALDHPSFQKTLDKANAERAKAGALPDRTEELQLAKAWAYSQMNKTPLADHLERLKVTALTEGQKIRYTVDGAEHFGVIAKASNETQTVSALRFQLPDHDHGKATASDRTDHIPYRFVTQVLEDWPTATDLTTAFNNWIMGSKE